MRNAIFLSASVPDPQRAPELAKTADSVAISSAISALLYVSLGRRPIVWGGHPAITPMIWAVAAAMDVDYGSWVKLYQSQYWKDQYPEDNERFRNVTYTENVEEDRERSLQLMRETMFREHHFSHAVFIGGMQGIFDEFELFQKMHPEAQVVPVATTGGAAALLNKLDVAAEEELDYVAFFQKFVGVSPLEPRRSNPE